MGQTMKGSMSDDHRDIEKSNQSRFFLGRCWGFFFSFLFLKGVFSFALVVGRFMCACGL